MTSLASLRLTLTSVPRSIARQRHFRPFHSSVTARCIHASSFPRATATLQEHKEPEPHEHLIDQPIPSPASTTAVSSPPTNVTPTVINSNTTLPTHIHTYPITINPLTLPPNPTFADLHVSSHIHHRLNKFGLTKPTLIQCAAIPYLTHHPSLVSPTHPPPDVLITDEPGTGKTLTYLLPLLSQLNPYLHALQAVVIVPSRALAVQLTKVIGELNSGGRKARQRNPLRVDMCVGHVNPAMIAAVTQPRRPPQLPKLPVERSEGAEGEEAGVPVGRVEVPSEFVADNEDDGLLLGSEVSQLLVGTPQVLHELLVKREELDCRELRYVVVDEADGVLGNEADARLVADLLALRNKPPPRTGKSATPRLPASNSSLATAASASAVSSTATASPLLAPPVSTQVVLVSSVVTPELLRFSARHLSPNRDLLSPASVPALTIKQRRTLLSHSTTSPSSINRPSRVILKQQLHLPATLSHSYALYPQAATREQKGQMLLQLLLAIRSSMRHTSPVVGQPQWVRHVGSRLKGGMGAVPPLSDRLPQSTLVLFRSSDDVFPLLSLLSSHLRIAVLMRRSSRSELRDALSMTPPADVVVAMESELRGLDLKAVSHVVNYSQRSGGMSAADYYRRAGRCGRKGAVWREGRVITMCRDGAGEVVRLERLVVGMGARGLTQVVVRGERLYERGRGRLNRRVSKQTKDDERELTANESAGNVVGGERESGAVEQTKELRPARYLDSLLGTGKRTVRASS